MAWNGLVAELVENAALLRSGAKEMRREKRLRLCFETSLADTRGAPRAVVLDLSRVGFLIHTGHPLAVGDTIGVELPEAGLVEARVVWKRVTLYGCEFTVPVSRAAISATMLKAPGPGPGRID
jgi:PilZ domain